MGKRLLFFLGMLLLFASHSYAQKTISGVVKDESGEVVISALVEIKGYPKLRTKTDFNGKFTLNNVPNGSVIKVTMTGLKTIEQPVGNQTNFNFSMKSNISVVEIEDDAASDGYMTINDKMQTTSALKVDKKVFKNTPNGAFTKALQGQSGVLVSEISGRPGAAPIFRIRGNGTPLYVVDGIPILPNQFESLNPSDFASITILKGAKATSIYGSRGSNGVMVITTKRGQVGKTQFTYNFQTGLSHTPRERLLGRLNGPQKIQFEQEIGDGPTSGFKKEKLDSLRQIDTDWADEILQTARITQHEISAAGGNKRMRFYTSLGYFKQGGIVKTTSLERYSARINMNFYGDNYRFGFSVAPSYSKNNLTNSSGPYTESPLNAIYWANAYQRPYDSTSTNGYGWLTLQSMFQPNAIEQLMLNKRRYNEVKVLTNIYGEYDIPKVNGLSIRSKWGIDFSYRDGSFFRNPKASQYTPKEDQPDPKGPTARAPWPTYGMLSVNTRRYTSFVGTNSLNYSKRFAKVHQVTAGLFSEILFINNYYLNYVSYGFTGKLYNPAGATQGSEVYPDLIASTGGGTYESALVSQFADINYGFKEKYSLSFGVRRDGSSKFADKNKYGIFWSVGAAWNIHEEAFLKGNKIINRMKLRTSYGTVGNQSGIGSFAYLTTYGQSGRRYDGLQGVGLSNIGNPDLLWETKKKLNVAFDFGFIKRIFLTTEYYDDLNTDVFFNKQVTRTNGFNSQSTNIGKLRDRGFEINLEVLPVINENLTWSIKANMTRNWNKIEKLFEDEDELLSTGFINKVGLPLNTYNLVPYLGVDPADGEPLFEGANGEVLKHKDIKYKKDVRPYKSARPTFFGGLTNTVTYKGFEISALLSYAGGNGKLVSERANFERWNYASDGFTDKVLNRWRQPGDLATFHRFKSANGKYKSVGYGRSVVNQTTLYYEELDFIRLRKVSLSYNFPAKVFSKIKASALRVYLQGQNLLLFTKYSGTDPESAYASTAGMYPSVRTYTLGATVTF